ncbi:MAG: CoA transferase [Rhodocyclaceae bacterium]|nr:MAG: CoA transferase [Rhodocyclaceae bacterium]
MKKNAANLPRPLEGFTVLDFTTALAGPYATLLLAGLGARIIKVENPLAPDSARSNSPYLGRDGVTMARTHEDDVSVAMAERGRNKLSITLNMKQKPAKKIFVDLVKHADAIVENYSAGTADRMGIGYAVASEINPRIVFTSISGFGANLVNGQNKAMDTIVQALSGLMMTSGAPGDPPVRVGIPFGDLSAPLFAVIGTIAALMQAQRTGRGQHVDVSLLGALTSMVACEPFEAMERAGQETRTGNTMPRLAPFGIFPTTDGFISICAPRENFAAALFDEMGMPDLIKDPRFNSRDGRVKNHKELHALVESWTSKFTTDEAVARLEQAGVPSGAVRRPAEGVRDPRLLARGETELIEHPKYGKVDELYGGGMPILMSGSFTGFDRPAPGLGEHNELVYRDLLGYSSEEIAELKAGAVI